MEKDVRIETLALMSISIFVVLAITAFIIPFGDDTNRFFFIGLAAALASVNVIGFFMIWRASPTIIDEIFLMTHDGMLLKHYTRRLRPDQDEHIMAGMLTAVQTFIKESFDESGGKLREIKFENYDIVISHSKNVVIAAILSTKKPEKLRNQLRMVTEEIEEKFGHRIGKWSGDRAELGDVDHVMKMLISGRYRR
jgi:N-methylhydantoinase A/oxoprolinase/acetone carboxylase beta subunit